MNKICFLIFLLTITTTLCACSNTMVSTYNTSVMDIQNESSLDISSKIVSNSSKASVDSSTTTIQSKEKTSSNSSKASVDSSTTTIQSNEKTSSNYFWDVSSYVSTTKVKNISKEKVLFYIEDSIVAQLPKTLTLNSGVMTFTYEQKTLSSPQKISFSNITGEFEATEVDEFIRNYTCGKKVASEDYYRIANLKYSQIMKENPDAVCFCDMRTLSNSYQYNHTTYIYTLIYPKENGKYAFHIHGSFYNKYLLEGCLQIQQDGSAVITENPIF